MFRLFFIDQSGKEIEVFSENGVYIVYELYEYKFRYEGIIIDQNVFIEDELFDYDNKLLVFTESSILTADKKRIFEDYFGYLKLKINSIDYKFEVRIQKLKVPELEEILLYLWNQDPVIFDNFFSKSTLKSRLDKENQSLDFSSKFVNIFEDYHDFFKSHFFNFKSLPHTVLRAKGLIKDYEFADVSSTSVEWLVHNLDELHVDYLYRNNDNSIQIQNNYGLIEKIFTEEKVNDFNIYENKIILGSFEYVFLELLAIKNKIRSYLLTPQYYEKNYYSINDFKIIPFLKLKDDLDKIETKIRALYNRYKGIFVKAKPQNAFPRLTPVFINKRHYANAYNKIKLIRDVKINFEGELNLLNIRKVSTLYERFNLFVIVNSILEKSPVRFSASNPKMEDNVYQEFHFDFPHFKLSVYYDTYIGNNENRIGLQRISKSNSKNYDSGYRPDYVIKIESEGGVKFFILDSKYSTEFRTKNTHLNLCIKKYILDLGITDDPNLKVDELVLVYPGKNEETIYGNDIFKPKISIIPSKIGIDNLKKFIDRILTI